ncbi:Kelch repeat-containing protein [Undibacterium pigrum]|uniref:Kelch motif protein n=1 Tax=Undibacterium pigrum TaxID=401470 RepID=A0A318JEI4_9BURK|nr:kelch repeat-containing protein [Undibacterium pigrum]PXX45203.1 Kelch motif protein [Undibacterium pigrum]
MKLPVFLSSMLVAANAFSVSKDSQVNTWLVEPIRTMTTARAVHQVIPINTNELLVSGGCGGEGCSPVHKSTEIFNIADKSFKPASSMNTPRVSHGVAVLGNGDVLIAGGWTGQASTASAELFNSKTRSFQNLPSMTTPRIDPVVLALNDGRVLVAGGATAIGAAVSSAEIFNPASAKFSATSAMQQPRTHHAAVKLADGRILITGGLRAKNAPLASAEIFDPRSNTFVSTASMSGPRYKHAAVALADGRVMVIGGSAGRDEHNRLASTEIYDPAANSFKPGPNLISPRFKIPASAAVLPSGAVFIAGGADDVEVWQPGAASFNKVNGTLGTAVEFASATALPNGHILVLGGYDEQIRSTARAWLVKPKI